MKPPTIEMDDIEVLISHPMAEDAWIPLLYWMENGPGLRRLLRPLEARHKTTLEPLSLEVIPLPYRNNEESRRLIREGIIPDPWQDVEIVGVSKEELQRVDHLLDHLI